MTYDYTGKSIIVAFTYFDSDGSCIDTKQFHGEIIRFDEKTGIEIINRKTSEIYTLPPRIDALFPAPSGEYVENISGEIIHNPDFITMWNITRQPGSDDKWEWCAVKLDSLSQRQP